MEFRYFNGTLHAGEVKAYVQLPGSAAWKGLRRDRRPAIDTQPATGCEEVGDAGAE